MKCADCCYCWREDGEKYPSCHWQALAPGEMAPCEYEEEEYDDEQ